MYRKGIFGLRQNEADDNGQIGAAPGGIKAEAKRYLTMESSNENEEIDIMYSLSFLIVELETARTTLLGVFEVSNGTANWTWKTAISGCAVRPDWPLI
jgi:hypothetical protein